MHVVITLRIVQRVAYAGTNKDSRISSCRARVCGYLGFKAPYLAADLVIEIARLNPVEPANDDSSEKVGAV